MSKEEIHINSFYLRYSVLVLISFFGIILTLIVNYTNNLTSIVTILLIVIVSGFPIYIESLENLRAKHMTMELSMTIAIVAALLIDQFFTAIVIIMFVLIAEILEEVTVDRGKRAMADILSYLPQTITIVENNRDREISIYELNVGDIVLIKPGLRIPVDGTVLSGHSFVDQSFITGESIPVEKNSGTYVFAGSMNQLGTLSVKTEKIGSKTIFGAIIEEIELSNQTQSPIQKTADTLASYLVYFAITSSIITYLVTRNIISAISVIIVAGACGIAAGTPLAILGGLSQATLLKTIVKGGINLERLAKIDTVVLDKTGTLTLGKPEVISIYCEKNVSTNELLFIAGCVERHSEHPIAQAILRKCNELNIDPKSVEEFNINAGKGISGKYLGKQIIAGTREFLQENGVSTPNDLLLRKSSDIYISFGGNFLGSIEIADKLRNESYEVIQELHRMKIHTILLSGDDPEITRQIAKYVGIQETHGSLLPAEKAEWIEKYQQAGRSVVMIGDGINDALAIKNAHVGIAMGSGTDFTIETADIVLLGNDLRKFVDLYKLSRRTRKTIFENFYGTLFVDGLGIILAGFGFLSPIYAVFVHVSSELLFILNSSRLIPMKRRTKEIQELNLPAVTEHPIMVPKTIQDFSPS